jgi:hypothetical protein
VWWKWYWRGSSLQSADMPQQQTVLITAAKMEVTEMSQWIISNALCSWRGSQLLVNLAFSHHYCGSSSSRFLCTCINLNLPPFQMASDIVFSLYISAVGSLPPPTSWLHSQVMIPCWVLYLCSLCSLTCFLVWCITGMFCFPCYQCVCMLGLRDILP